MKIKRTFLFPAIIFFTDKLPSGTGGQARGPVIFIRKKYQRDPGLLAHELTHVRQWFLSFGLHSLLYLTIKKYKLWAEISAYREQLKYSPGMEEKFAGFISEKYGLNVTKTYALRRLEI